MSSFYQLLITVLAWLALPVILVALYDHFVLQPGRPRTPEGEPAPGPSFVRVANALLPFVILAAVLRIGVSDVFAWAKEVARPLAWLAAPVGLICAIDSWIFAPRRAVATGALGAKDPAVLRVLYGILPILVIAVIVRLISAESLDFSLVLLLLSLATGLVWLIDHLVFRKQRELAMQKGVGGEMTVAEPGTVDYARSFFPVAFIVLIVRAFIFEPFRIPSDSMMPTLLDGDFIVVSKYSYGLRLPVLNTKMIATGSPQRGDVMVFRYPPDPRINYIKRLVGLPGDRIEVRDDHLVVNGEVIQQQPEGHFNDGCYVGMRLTTETLGEHTHQVMSCRSPRPLLSFRDLAFTGIQSPPPNCNRKQLALDRGGYLCDESGPDSAHDINDHVFEFVEAQGGGYRMLERGEVPPANALDVLPPGYFIMIGDNRDNSADSRSWGLVPEQNLVGKATRIWLNFDPQRPLADIINWGRIGKSIE
jgi:signal peptidase I